MDLSALTAALDLLVLERMPDGRFVRQGVLPAWCGALRSEALRGSAPFAAENVFELLTAFLPQGTDAWRCGGARVDSDFWTEVGADGEEIHLEASALRVGDADVLVITKNDRLFDEKRFMLQRARELRFTHDALTREMEQKDILVHTIVHDLAAPLHSILGTLSLLAEQDIGEPSSGRIALALRAAMRQRHLINEILDVFAAERDRLGGAPDPSTACEVGEVLAQVVAEREPVARRRGVRLETAVACEACRVSAEPARLFRVLTNLVDNALGHGGTSETVRVVLRRDGETVVIAVEDEGPGVPDDLVPELFEMFARARDGRGHGLGLYFCRISVERWGGTIGYEPREGGGARFWVRLPIAPHRT